MLLDHKKRGECSSDSCIQTKEYNWDNYNLKVECNRVVVYNLGEVCNLELEYTEDRLPLFQRFQNTDSGLLPRNSWGFCYTYPAGCMNQGGFHLALDNHNLVDFADNRWHMRRHYCNHLARQMFHRLTA